MHFTKQIINWYHSNKRDLPFRNDYKDPYKVWISEIILQQTQLIQGLPYYFKIIDKYPTVHSLAEAKEKDILLLWQGLGYYSRARNLHYSARYISEKLKGKFPDNYRDILNLKGIGPYTAAAISSISFNEQIIALDGNGYRFLSRYFGIDDCIDDAKGKQKIFEIGQELVPKKNPGDFNQAIIEIGALICKPQNPLCNACPVQNTCQAFKFNLINELPVRKKKNKPQIKYLYYFFVQSKEGKILLRKRTESGIWKNLYELPVYDPGRRINLKNIPESTYWKNLFKKEKPIIHSISKEYKHILSHQILKARFFEVEVKNHKHVPTQLIKVKISDLDSYPVPRLMDKFFQQKQLA